jgi:iron complex outermembrane receptor protein
MRLGLILLSLLCLPWALSAQKAEITGQVTEAESNEALFAVNVVIKGSTKGVTTDFDGNYSLMVDPGSYTVQFSFLGFETIERNLEVSADQVYTLNIQLSKKAEVISGVTVSSEGKFEKDLSETTVSMEVVKESFITQNATTSADETLNKIPGVQILGEGASIRGGSGFSAGAGSRVLFLVDGLPMFTPDNGTVQFESMPTENLAQIEVIKGASSALYGSSALNGVINFQTADPTTTAKNKVMLNFGFYNQPPNRDVSWNWRQPDTAKGTVRTTLRKFGNGSFSHSKKYKTLDVSFGANYKQDAGYLESGDQTRIRLGGKLKWRPKNFMRLNLGLNANFTYESAGFFFFWNGLDSAQYVPFREEYGQTTMRTVAIDPFVNFYDKKDNRHSLKFRFYNTETDNTNEEYVNSNMYFMDYTFLKRYEEKDFNITTGATGYVTNSRTQTFGDHSSGNLGMYAQFEKRFADVVTVNAGVRLEYYQVDSIKTEHKLTVLNTIFNRDSTNLLTSALTAPVPMCIPTLT